MALVDDKTEGEVSREVTNEEAGAEEDCSPEFVPIVQLQEVKTVRGDENETVVWENKCKLYRFDVDAWKERGLGQAKILKHKTNNKQRFVMHEDKTLKLRANHLILPDTKLQEHGGNEKALAFSTIDFADEKAKQETFCIRFGTAEKAQEFRAIYEAAIKENSKYLNSISNPESTNNEEEKTAEEEAVEKLGKDLETKVVVEEDSKEDKVEEQVEKEVVSKESTSKE